VTGAISYTRENMVHRSPVSIISVQGAEFNVEDIWRPSKVEEEDAGGSTSPRPTVLAVVLVTSGAAKVPRGRGGNHFPHIPFFLLQRRLRPVKPKPTT
jgi:hypothetical protein